MAEATTNKKKIIIFINSYCFYIWTHSSNNNQRKKQSERSSLSDLLSYSKWRDCFLFHFAFSFVKHGNIYISKTHFCKMQARAIPFDLCALMKHFSCILNMGLCYCLIIRFVFVFCRPEMPARSEWQRQTLRWVRVWKIEVNTNCLMFLLLHL